jgi:hypothetical protein
MKKPFRCIKCKRENVKHQGHGLCSRCYMREFESRPETKERIAKRRNSIEYKEHCKKYLLQRNYGLTIEDKNKIIESQSGLCPICLRALGINQGIHIDHDHVTGKIRGILCLNCNVAMGHFHDSIPTLKNAIKYLEGR